MVAGRAVRLAPAIVALALLSTPLPGRGTPADLGGDAGPPLSDRALDPGLVRREARIRRIDRSAGDALESGRLDEVRPVLLRILEIDPQHPLAYLGAVLLGQRQGGPVAAEAMLAGLPAPPGPGLLYGRGTLRFLEGRSGDAEALLQEALAAYRASGHPSGEAACRTGLGNVRLRQSRYADAAADYEAARLILERLGDRRGLADILSNVGNLRAQQGDLGPALEAYRRALAVREEIDDRAGTAIALHNIGAVERRRGEGDRALEALDRALTLHRDLGDHGGEVNDLNLIGLVRADRGEAGPAAEAFRQSLDRARAIGDRRAEANALTNLASADLRTGAIEGALREHEASLAIRRDLGDRPGVVASLNNIAAVRVLRGERGEALRLYGEALETERGLADRSEEAALLTNLGRLRVALGQTAEGIAALGEAAGRARQTGDGPAEAAALAERGRARLQGVDFAGARADLDRALQIARRGGDRRGEADGLDGQGLLADRLGDFAAAIDRFGGALPIARDLRDAAREALIREHLGNARFARGEFAEAIREHEASLALRRGLGDLAGQATNLGDLGAIDAVIGERGRAEGRLREALDRMRALSNRSGEALVRADLGVLLEEGGDREAAIGEYRASVALREGIADARGAALTRCNLAEALRRGGRVTEAEEEIGRALRTLRSLGDRAGETLALEGLGDLERGRGRQAEAAARYGEALRLARSGGMREEAWRAEAGIGACHESAGRLAEALASYRRAIADIEAIRSGLVADELRSLYLSGRLEVYEAALRVLWRQGAGPERAASAFACAEGARARGLLDLLEEARADLHAGIEQGIARQEGEILARLNEAGRRLRGAPDPGERELRRREVQEAQADLDLLRVRMRTSAGRYADLVYPAPAGIREVRRAILRPGETLLEYFVGDDASYLWIVSRGRTDWRRLPPRAEIEAAARPFLDLLRTEAADLGPREAWREAARRLGRLILPARPPAEGRLVVVADGILSDLPFEALIAPWTAGPGGRLLIEEREVSYAPSASAIRSIRSADRRSGAAPRRLLAIGDPALPAGPPEFAESAPLPFAREEASRIAALFPADDRTLLLGPEATEEALDTTDLREVRYLHIAAHGLIDETAPQRSGLLLAPGSPDRDGLLQMSEIFRLRLGADVAVLSGCRTGLGPLVRGEGIVGLTRAFLYAGARSVVVSLWDVGDRSTADLMERFYRGLLAGKPPRTALREAKLALLGSGREADRHPSRWAPFILVGDPDPARHAEPTPARRDS
jgi:tetratricopeptide (TPR) repeat protein